jgi:hypothetical protein
VLEYCTGGSLDKAIDGRPQPPPEAARLVEKLARAVQAAHDVGIIHRDLKPANVLLAPPGDEPALNTPWGIPKVADFGLCRLLQADVQRTAEGAVAGSPSYMAPEQAQGRIGEIGPATDVWTLGVILYELLTGRRPFAGASMLPVLHAVCYDEPPRPGELRADVPAELEAICLRCLRKRAEERYPRAADLAEALRGWLAQADTSTRALPQKSATARRSTWPKRGVLAAGVLAAVLLAVTWARRNQPAPAVPTELSAGSSQRVGSTEPAPTAKPLTVDFVKVWKLQSEGFNRRVVGELGKTIYRVRKNDVVRVEARLSEPAYAYFVLFNPADKPGKRVQCFPSEDQRPARLQDVGPEETIILNDGVGLQALAVIASRQELPPFSQWRQQHARALAWERVPATSGVVWLADGEDVEGLYGPGSDRATAGHKEDRGLIRRLAVWFKSLPEVDAVKVVGFAVDPED